MNQPKFHFGDHVTNTITNESFTVKAITKDTFGQGFSYSGDIDNPRMQSWHRESVLEIKESIPFVYKSKSGKVGIFDSYLGLGFHANGEIFRFSPDDSCKEQENTGLDQ